MIAKSPAPCVGILAAILMLGIPPAPAGAQAQNLTALAVERLYSTVGRCGTVAVGDFDGDGDSDLAVAEGNSTAISLWWNDGRAGFDGRGAFQVGHPYITFIALDVDADGRPDLAVADSLPGGGVEIFRGLGQGHFGPGARVTSSPTAVLIASDLNADRRVDLIVGASSEPFGAQVLLQTQEGNFVALASTTTEGLVTALASADFDGDGIADLALAEPGAVRVLRGDGTGGLGTLGSFAQSRTIGTLIAIDLDRDGRVDLLSGGTGESQARDADIHLNLGGGVFGASTLVREDFRGGLGVADIDRNGDLEIFASAGDSEEGQLHVYDSVEDALARRKRPYSLFDTDRTITRIISAPLDGDLQPDLIITHTARNQGGKGSIAILVTRPNGTPGAIGIHFLSNANGTGNADGTRAVRFARTGPSELVWFGSLGTWRAPVSPDGVPEPGRRISDAVEAWPLDANGDGREDLALRFGVDSIGIALTGNDGESQPVSSWVTGQWLAAGDLDGDHRPEIALSRGADGDVVIAWNNPRGSFVEVTPTGLRKSARDALTIGELIGGGAGELILFDYDFRCCQSGTWYSNDTLRAVRVYSNGEVKTLVQSIIPTAQGNSSYYDNRIRAVVAADIDGDHRNELVALRAKAASGGRLQVLRNAEGSFVADDAMPRISPGNDDMLDDLSLADVDADGDLDAVCGSNHEGYLPMIEIRWNDGGGRFDEYGSRIIAYRHLRQVEVADLDGDGTLDILAGMNSAAGLLFGERGPAGKRVPHPQNVRPGRPHTRLAITVAGATATGNALSTIVEVSAGDAALDLYDLAGRRVVSRSVVAGMAGPQQVGMPLPRTLTKGIYWLVLRQGAERATMRVAIIR